MLIWIVNASLRFRFLVVGCAIVMMLYGLTQLRTMPVDVFPEFAPPKVEIQTSSLGLSAVEVEELAFRLRGTRRTVTKALLLLENQGRAKRTKDKGRWKLQL